MGLNTLRFLSFLVVALALIPAAALLVGLKIPLCLECAYLMLMSAGTIGLIVIRILGGTGKASWQIRIALVIASVCIMGMQVIFWKYTFPANQQTMNWASSPAHFNLIALILLIISVLSQIPPKKYQEPVLSQEEKKKKEDINLALYTFYEGRVQTTKSILVGILTGILSLQIPIYLEVATNKQPNSSLEDPIVLLFIHIATYVYFYEITYGGK